MKVRLYFEKVLDLDNGGFRKFCCGKEWRLPIAPFPGMLINAVGVEQEVKSVLVEGDRITVTLWAPQVQQLWPEERIVPISLSKQEMLDLGWTLQEY